MVRRVAVFEFELRKAAVLLRHVAAGSDPVGASFAKSDPHLNLGIKSLHATLCSIELLQLLSSHFSSSPCRGVHGSLHFLMHDMEPISFASPSAPTGKMYSRTYLRHTQGRWISWETYISPCHLYSNLVSLRPHQSGSFPFATLLARLQAYIKLIV